MSFSEDILQRIEDYLNGDMPAEQVNAFESQMAHNPDLVDLVNINKKMRLQYGEDGWDFIEDDENGEALKALETLLQSKEFQDKKKAIQSASDLYFKNENSKGASNRTPRLYFALAVAAALVLFFGILFKDPGLTSAEIYSDNSSWKELPSFVSRGETDTELLSAGEEAFTNKDYSLAEARFSAYLESSHEVNVTALLYLGVSQLEGDNYNAALESFQKIIDSKTLDQSKGYWYKALAYLKRGDKDNARIVLEVIARHPDYFNHTKAIAILEVL